MNLRSLIAEGLILIILLACTRPDHTENNINPNGSGKLTNFSVKVLERTSISAVIQWDSSLNTTNSEPVKYRVILNNKVISNNLSRLIDTLQNLNKDTTYSGKVVAYIGERDTTFSEFTLSTYDGSIYANTTDGFSHRFGGFNAYPIPGLNVQSSLWRIYTRFMLTPTLSNDTLFTVTNGRLTAVNATNGSTIWQAPETINLITSVTYDKGRLYACSGSGQLLAVNSSNGQIIWSYSSTTSWMKFDSQPVLDGDKVFVATTNSSHGEIHAVNPVSGQKIWSIQIYNSFCNRPLAANGVLVISSGSLGKVSAFDQNTGSLIWSKSNLVSVGGNQFNPVYIDGKALVHTSITLYALNLQTGREEWKYEYSSLLYDCVTGNGMIYFCKDSTGLNQSNTQNVICLDAKTGKLVWRTHATVEGQRYARLVFAKDKIYCLLDMPDGAFSTKIVALNATNGLEDLVIRNNNPISLKLYESVVDFCVKRDGVVYYRSSHGNYK